MKKFVQSWFNQWGGIVFVTPLVTLVVLGVRGLGFLQPWELGMYDLYLRLRPQLPRDERIAIVGITEAEIQEYESGILPDTVYAELFRKLAKMQPAVMGLDIYRNVPEEPGHEELQQVFREMDNIIGITKFRGDVTSGVVPPPPILAEKGQIGANDVIQESDSRIRRGFVSLANVEGEELVSFGVHLALLYLEEKGKLDEAKDMRSQDKWRLRPELFPDFHHNTGGYVKAFAGGDQILINYRGGKDHFETVSLNDILEGNVPDDWGRDRIILIGPTSVSSNDFFLTPYSSGIFTNPEPIPGVAIQAHLASQVLSTVLDGRPPLRTLSDPLEWLWTLFWAGTGAFLTWKYRYGINSNLQTQKKQGLNSLLRILSPPLMVGLLGGSTYLAIVQGWWLPIVPPLLAFLGTTAVNITYQAYTAGKIRQTFGRYLTNDVVSQLLDNPQGLKLGGQRQQITILTSDVRGFTALSERFPPEQVVSILNVYLQPMLDTIVAYGGTVNGLMGDGILAFFGVPTVKEDDAKRAVACAIAMQLAMDSVNAQMEQNHWPLLEMGIGINTGDAVVGNLGSELYTQYSAIGSEVNLAFRVETYTQGNQVFIAENTLNAVGQDWVKICGEKRVKPKGVMNEISLYEIEGVGEPYHLALPKKEEQFSVLAEPIAISYVTVAGKQVSDRNFPAQIIQLSSRGALLQNTETQETPLPPPMTNLKLNLVSSDLSDDDIYAKVTAVNPDQQQFTLHFTYRSPEVTAKLKSVNG